MAQLPRSDRLRAHLASGHSALGTFLQMRDPLAVEVAGRAGFDFAVVDLEHGSLMYPDVPGMARAADLRGLALLVRVPLDRLAMASQLLDSGCRGVFVPRIQTADEARRVVAATRYTPSGNRGVCPGTRANDVGWLEWEEHVTRAEASTIVCVALEDPIAIAAAPEIAAVPGLDVIFVGAFDLAAELGLRGQVRHPAVLEAVRSVVAAARLHGVSVGAVAANVAGAREWHEMGLRFLPISTDVLLWRETCTAIADEWCRSVLASEAEIVM